MPGVRRSPTQGSIIVAAGHGPKNSCSSISAGVTGDAGIVRRAASAATSANSRKSSTIVAAGVTGGGSSNIFVVIAPSKKTSIIVAETAVPGRTALFWPRRRYCPLERQQQSHSSVAEL